MRHGELCSCVFPGMSTSSSSSSHHSTSRTLSRQERTCFTSSSSSSSSPTTSLSDNETWEREDRTESDTSPVPVSIPIVDDRKEQPVVDQANQKLPITSHKETKIERCNPVSADSSRASSERPEWLQECKENLVDDEVPERGDSHVSFFHQVSLQPTFKRREDLGKHSVYFHFPKDWNYLPEDQNYKGTVQKKYWQSRTSCRKIGDLLTADHKVLSECCESRNSHRYAVVVQDLATQWIQSYPCKQKLLRKHKGACKSSWSQIGNLKSCTLTIPWNSAKLVKIFPGIIARRHHIDQKQMLLPKEQCAE